MTTLSVVPRITVRQLNRRGACLDQVTRFRMRFGNEALITVETCVEVADEFSFEWACDALLHVHHGEEVERVVRERMRDPSSVYETVLAEEFAKKYMEVYPNVP